MLSIPPQSFLWVFAGREELPNSDFMPKQKDKNEGSCSTTVQLDLIL